MKTNTRRTASFIFSRWILTHEFPSEMLPKGASEDRSFIQDLVYTAIRRFRPLRRILGELVTQWPKGELESLLIIGAAQILYMPSVPDFAAVNETVDAARACPNPNIAKVVNGVLRNLIRRREEFEKMIRESSLAERESYPNAIVSRWISRYGKENAEKLALWHNLPAETYIANKPDSGKEPFVLLPRGCRVTDQPGFAEGEFIVQDPATALAVELLDIKPGLSVLDCCAAPGGKTVQIAWRLNASARLLATDVNPSRLNRLRENLKRLHLDWVQTCSVPPENTLFDRVLADVPCSNTGVFRRRVDARWRWSVESLEELAVLQESILENAASHVAPGGILFYSTCSNEPEENQERIEAFLAKHPEFTELSRKESIPFETGHDGAFACAMQKRQ
jgi:16S rRNA (cytosine967-C5)-methyltransferase